MSTDRDERSRGETSGTEPSVSASLEHLVAGSQGVISKRIDLALLEARELFSRSLESAVLVVAAMVLAGAAWFAGVGALVLYVVADAGPIVRLAAFGLANGAGAIALALLARRRIRPPAAVVSNGSPPEGRREQLLMDGEGDRGRN